MNKNILLTVRHLMATILALALVFSLASCALFSPSSGSKEEEQSTTGSESETQSGDDSVPYGRYRYWSSDVSEGAVEIDTEGNSAKFYSLQTGYYSYYTVDEATYRFEGDVLVLTLGGKDYNFHYDDNENTLTIKNNSEEEDDIVYEAMEEAPTAHPTYTFPKFSELSFPSSFKPNSLYLSEIRDFSIEEAKIKIATDYYEGGLETFPLITDRPIKSGDYINIDYIGRMNGVYLENSGANDHPLAIIKHPENIDGVTYPEEFIQGMIGRTVGEQFSIDIVYPEGHANAGKTATYDITINAIYDTTLTMTQLQNYEDFEYESYDAYLLATAKSVASHLAIPYVIKETNATNCIPEEAYLYFYQQRLDEAHYLALRSYKVDYERYLTITGQSEALFMEQAKAEATDFMIAYYIVRENNLKWTDEQYKTQYDNMVLSIVQNGINQDKAKEIVENQQMDLLYANLTYQIAAEFLAAGSFAIQPR